ncbi:DUF6612 family protein [Alkalihalobacterium chitinilyticum]|uniref:Uncharacterized protein n=1 Tax=Alkalihalobacterium chitinilyticum TaxID=2980103 RepID=A0ABT5VF24_9BACI|nr:DUF6612 family protein [Alkalihalobacterium chitinilyticum]MDE5414064.1 hypothetical protein [Alkalihalobacterium chitinilyticum]
MSSIKALFASLSLIFVLAACSGGEETSSPNADIQDTADVSAVLSVDEIIQKSINAMNKLESYTMETNIEQIFDMPGQDAFQMNMMMVADTTSELVRLYQKRTSTEFEENSEVTQAESYFTEDGMFVKNPIQDSWVRYPREFSQDILEASQQQMNAEEHLKAFKQFTEDTKLTEDENHYILTVHGSDESFKAMVYGAISILEKARSTVDELLGMMEVQTFNYVIYIDKDTFYQTKMDMEMHMSLTIEDETMVTIHRMTGVITNFNSSGEITVPQDVLDSAEEFNFEFLEGLEDMEDFDLEDFDFDVIEEDELIDEQEIEADETEEEA